MNIQNNIKITNNISQELRDIMSDVISGKIDLKKADTINRLARTSINATKEGVMMAHHQQIQRDKIMMRQKEIEIKEKHINLQYFKLKQT